MESQGTSVRSSNGIPFSARAMRTLRAYGEGVAEINWNILLESTVQRKRGREVTTGVTSLVELARETRVLIFTKLHFCQL